MMHSVVIVEIVFGSLISLILFSAWASRLESWQKRISTSKLLFRMPPTSRFGFAAIGLWLVLTPASLMAHYIRDETSLLLFAIYELMACALGSLFIWAFGTRRELSLHLDGRSYRFTTGWGPWTQVRAGSFEDFEGTFVRCTSSKNGESYTVGLAWKSGGMISPTLGSFRGHTHGKTKADALAAETAYTLNMPLVTAPPPETLRDVLRRSKSSSR